MTMQLYNSYIDPLDSSYQGKAQQATFWLSDSKLDIISSFFVDQWINDCKNAVKQQSPSDDVLRMEVYRDTAPPTQINYVMIITSTDRTGADLLWNLIMLVAFAVIIAYLIVLPILQAVQNLFYGLGGEPGSPSLIGMIPWLVGGLLIYGLVISGAFKPKPERR